MLLTAGAKYLNYTNWVFWPFVYRLETRKLKKEVRSCQLFHFLCAPESLSPHRVPLAPRANFFSPCTPLGSLLTCYKVPNNLRESLSCALFFSLRSSRKWDLSPKISTSTQLYIDPCSIFYGLMLGLKFSGNCNYQSAWHCNYLISMNSPCRISSGKELIVQS